MKKIFILFTFFYYCIPVQAKSYREPLSVAQSPAKKYPKLWFAKDIGVGALSTAAIGYITSNLIIELGSQTNNLKSVPISTKILANVLSTSIPIITLISAYTIKKGWGKYKSNKNSYKTKGNIRKKQNPLNFSPTQIILGASAGIYALLHIVRGAMVPHKNCNSILCYDNKMAAGASLTFLLAGIYSMCATK
jgi:hypothetical protein